MAWRKGLRDWQERAFDAGELSRKDRDSAKVADLPDPYKESADLPKRSSWRWTAWGIAAIIIAIAIRSALNSSGAPALTTSCTTPAFALSTTHTHQGATIHWAATGPAKTKFLMTIGVGALKPGAQPGQLSPVPDPGVNIHDTELVVLAHQLPSGCKTTGLFSVDVPAGTYNVRMFTLGGTGAAVAGTIVATKQMQVTS
jgi:hypothetical protein